ncbi:MAG: CDP-alcohol phosphatidyltransferase family protein [Prevotella sp.]|nr:CDP-alcohol phosphatidyltransferase family protein [Prevotella sp.]MBQ1645434.1 CDP-alcohol phosphatidyltransferase family protein [Prevotella sp.]MBQ1701469.1 CDP-alcohol phosphatidyltransferase family protein [Prevotella sp.]MBQ2169712.1 CDP-alcohol phosphatidyltransferase family protein [Prevotella sp.]MBQ2215045.1 CDP-alcohol phosphatidyltransferase family protein [Prevotella sp.]
MSKFKELLQQSFKSNDTEEWLDVHFTRPIGLVFALLWNKLGIHPNVITVLSIFLGIGAGYMFYFRDLTHNIMGVLFLMFANFCDSTDGQMARLTGKKTLIGRILDGFSGDIWFICIYAALAFRLMDQYIPFTDTKWGMWAWLLMAVAGILCHSPQSSLSDYYRQIHLFFLKGKENSELDNSQQQHAIYEEEKKKGNLIPQLFYYNYAKYCRSQERRTPQFQSFFKEYQTKVRQGINLDAIKTKFLDGSRPLMPFTNILTFNTRAICLYISCLIDKPWIYPLFEITVMYTLYIYMHRQHEKLCHSLSKEMSSDT